MTDVLELLKREDPVEVAELRAEEPPQDRLEAILASRSRRPRRRPVVARVLLPACGIAAIVAVVLALIGGSAGRSVDTAAAAALHRIADASRAQPPTLPPGDDRFLYFRLEAKGFLAMASEPPYHRGIRTSDDFGFLLDFRSTQEIWVGEHSGRVRNSGGAPTFSSPRDRRAWEEAGRPRLPPAYEDETPTNTGIERLRIPTDPNTLLRMLRARADASDEGNAWIFGTLITDCLREWGVRPKQRAALYEAAARLPGVELLDERTDPEGRRGTGFAMSDHQEHMRHTLIVDPDTGELLAAIAETLPGGPIPAAARAFTTFSSPVLVDAAGELPG